MDYLRAADVFLQMPQEKGVPLTEKQKQDYTLFGEALKKDVITIKIHHIEIMD